VFSNLDVVWCVLQVLVVAVLQARAKLVLVWCLGLSPRTGAGLV
jgi:hypothetical protein